MENTECCLGENLDKLFGVQRVAEESSNKMAIIMLSEDGEIYELCGP